MPMPASLPTAAQWEAVMTFRDLPILTETRDHLRRALKDPQVSFESLAPLAERDPALCWHLLQAATQQNPDCREQLNGAYSCLSLLGMQALVKLVKQLPVVEAAPTSVHHQRYRQALYTAHLAGCLAAQWASIRGTHTGMAHWSAMLAHSVLWPWLLLEERSHNWLFYLSQGDDLATAARKVFGDAPGNWQRLVRRHHLPEAAATLFRPERLPSSKDWQQLRSQDPRDHAPAQARPLVHLCQAPEMLTLTAAATAWSLHLAPEGKRSRRWLSLCSHTQGRALADIVRECRHLQLQEARLRRCGTASGIALLASPEPTHMNYPAWIDPALAAANDTAASEAADKPAAQEPTIQKPTAEETASGEVGDSAPTTESKESTTERESTTEKQTPVSEQPKPEEAQQGVPYLRQLMQRIHDDPSSFGDWQYLMQGAMSGLTQGLKMQGACILLPDKARTSLRAVYRSQYATLRPFTDGTVALAEAPLLRQLMKKPAGILITTDNRQQYLKGFPASVVQELPESFMCMSIAAGDQPIGIVIAARQLQGDLSDGEYRAFRALCGTTSEGLASLRKLRSQSAARA